MTEPAAQVSNEAVQASRDYLEHLLELLGVAAEISQEEIAGEPALQVETSDQALLIGRGGENLRALQYIVHQMVKRRIGDTPMITVDVAGYRKARLRQLDVMASLARSQALSESQPVTLAPMNAYERRYIHSILSDDAELTSESTGQEPTRRVVIRRAI